MNLRIIIILLFSLLQSQSFPQQGSTLNQTDKSGLKQGHWIKKYPDGNVMYDGFFRNDKPVGEFRRYYEDRTIKSLLVFNESGSEALATLYYQNGNVASKGKYINQLKKVPGNFFRF